MTPLRPSPTTVSIRTAIGLALIVGFASTTGGCREETVTTSEAPRLESSSTAPATTDGERADLPASARADADSMDRAVDDSAPGAAIDPEAPWQMPDEWSVSPSRPPMRHATLLLPDPDGDGDVEVAITRFPGDVGGMLANVNRWRSQVGLPDTTESELPAMLDRFSNPGYDGATLHLRGPRGDMLIASIHERAANRTWFVRVIAEPDTIDRVKDEVFAYARTFGLAE